MILYKQPSKTNPNWGVIKRQRKSRAQLPIQADSDIDTNSVLQVGKEILRSIKDGLLPLGKPRRLLMS